MKSDPFHGEWVNLYDEAIKQGVEFTFSLRSVPDDWSEEIRITDIVNREVYIATAGVIYDSLIAGLEAKRQKLKEKLNAN